MDLFSYLMILFTYICILFMLPGVLTAKVLHTLGPESRVDRTSLQWLYPQNTEQWPAHVITWQISVKLIECVIDAKRLEKAKNFSFITSGKLQKNWDKMQLSQARKIAALCRINCVCMLKKRNTVYIMRIKLTNGDAYGKDRTFPLCFYLFWKWLMFWVIYSALSLPDDILVCLLWALLDFLDSQIGIAFSSPLYCWNTLVAMRGSWVQTGSCHSFLKYNLMIECALVLTHMYVLQEQNSANRNNCNDCLKECTPRYIPFTPPDLFYPLPRHFALKEDDWQQAASLGSQLLWSTENTTQNSERQTKEQPR